MDNKKLTYEELLKETVVFYSEDVTRRGIDSATGECVYLDEVSGNQCAVGRCIDHNFRKGEEGDIDCILDNLQLEMKDLLLPKYNHLTNLEFWVLLQTLHDDKSYWNSRGLTDLGENRYLRLLEFAKKLDNE